MKFNGNVVSKCERFKYFGYFIEMHGSFKNDIKHNIKFGRMKWRKVLGVLCDKRILIKLKYCSQTSNDVWSVLRQCIGK